MAILLMCNLYSMLEKFDVLEAIKKYFYYYYYYLLLWEVEDTNRHSDKESAHHSGYMFTTQRENGLQVYCKPF